MTDERLGDALWGAIGRLPRGSGIVFRHHRTARAERLRLWQQVRALTRARGLLLLSAGTLLPGADGVHNPGKSPRRGWTTRAVHSRREAVAAGRGATDAIFVSPVFATRSHPDARALGPVRLGLLLRGLKVPVIALGGMDARKLRRLQGLGVYGWAGIDAWSDPPAAASRVVGRRLARPAGSVRATWTSARPSPRTT
ncbi:MAG: thiamine phosphate synthase [Pseudomonadota bacterium]